MFLVGQFYQSINIGTGQLNSAGSVDMLAAGFDGKGNARRANSFGSTSTDRAHGVTVSPNGQLLVVGEFQLSVDFGAGPLKSGGYADVTIVSFTP